MTFNEDIKIDSKRARTSRGRTTGAVIGGGGAMALLLVLLGQVFGVDLSGLVGNNAPAPEQPAIQLRCDTGADANADVRCRVIATAESLDAYWTPVLQQAGSQYTLPGLTIFENSVDTACGPATSAVGPFYCPNDQTVYIDTGFYDTLRGQFGASGGPLAEMYVIAHEFGHHVQNILGYMSQANRTDTGPDSDAVRLELQADCYAGMWANAAQNTVDPDTGVTFLEPLTRQQVIDALDAAAAVGDDRIQQSVNQQINPESWTHGSAEQRQKWFLIGMDGGNLQACDTFAVPSP